MPQYLRHTVEPNRRFFNRWVLEAVDREELEVQRVLSASKREVEQGTPAARDGFTAGRIAKDEKQQQKPSGRPRDIHDALARDVTRCPLSL
jgi:hypothetical protein